MSPVSCVSLETVRLLTIQNFVKSKNAHNIKFWAQLYKINSGGSGGSGGPIWMRAGSSWSWRCPLQGCTRKFVDNWKPLFVCCKSSEFLISVVYFGQFTYQCQQLTRLPLSFLENSFNCHCLQPSGASFFCFEKIISLQNKFAVKKCL